MRHSRRLTLLLLAGLAFLLGWAGEIHSLQARPCCVIVWVPETRTRTVKKVVYEIVYENGHPRRIRKYVYETQQYTVYVPVRSCPN